MYCFMKVMYHQSILLHVFFKLLSHITIIGLDLMNCEWKELAERISPPSVIPREFSPSSRSRKSLVSYEQCVVWLSREGRTAEITSPRAHMRSCSICGRPWAKMK